MGVLAGLLFWATHTLVAAEKPNIVFILADDIGKKSPLQENNNLIARPFRHTTPYSQDPTSK